jgi:hypothetical protein
MTESETKATRKQRKTIATAVAAIVTRRCAEKEKKTMPKKIETKTSDAGDAAPKRRGRPPKVKPLELEVASAVPELSTDLTPAMPTVKRVRTAKLPFIPAEELSTDLTPALPVTSVDTPMPELSTDLTPALPVSAPAADAWGEDALEKARSGGDAVVKFLGEDNPYAKMKADELLDAAGDIDRNAKPSELRSTRKAVLKAAVVARLDEADTSALLRIVGKNTDTTAKAMKDEFDRVRGEFDKIGAPTAKELATKQAAEHEAEVARLFAERRAKAEALEARVSRIAEDPALADKIVSFFGKKGAVGESSGILAVVLATMSRLNRRKSLSMLRRGAPSSGKNFVVELVLQMLDEGEDYLTFSGGSPKSMGYYGGVENVDAFKHKVLYLPEAAAIASKHGVEDDKALCIRLLLSEGRFSYPTVMKDEDGVLKSVIINKAGPISVITTSARDNVEPELLTRILVSVSDETSAQTALVVSETIDRAGGIGRFAADPELELWRDFNRWLRYGGPYDVVVPAELVLAIKAAYGELLLGVPLRIRRDVSSMLSGLASSAIMHRAQRKTDENGAIIAEVKDWAVAYDAFSDGIAALYRPSGSNAVVRLVEALEAMIAEEAQKAAAAKAEKAAKAGITVEEWGKQHPFEEAAVDTVRAPYRKIAKRLGITTTSTVSVRIGAAVAEGVIEVVETGQRGHGAAGTYRVLVPSKSLKSPVRNSPVIPTPQRVAELMADPQAAASVAARVKTEALAAKAAGLAEEHETGSDDAVKD